MRNCPTFCYKTTNFDLLLLQVDQKEELKYNSINTINDIINDIIIINDYYFFHDMVILYYYSGFYANFCKS